MGIKAAGPGGGASAGLGGVNADFHLAETGLYEKVGDEEDNIEIVGKLEAGLGIGLNWSGGNLKIKFLIFEAEVNIKCGSCWAVVQRHANRAEQAIDATAKAVTGCMTGNCYGNFVRQTDDTPPMLRGDDPF